MLFLLFGWFVRGPCVFTFVFFCYGFFFSSHCLWLNAHDAARISGSGTHRGRRVHFHGLALNFFLALGRPKGLALETLQLAPRVGVRGTRGVHPFHQMEELSALVHLVTQHVEALAHLLLSGCYPVQ